jgi:hypothetical protein
VLLIGLRVGVVAIVIGACNEARPPASSDVAKPGPESQTASVQAAKWDSALGEFVGYGSDTSVVVLLPSFSQGNLGDTIFDASRANGSKVDLFGPAGLVGSGVAVAGLGKSIDEDGCFEFSRGRVPAGQARWSVALPAGRATGIPLEALSSLQGPDSLLLADQVKALAGTAPGAEDSRWRDWPFTIENAVRFKIADATIVVASTKRILPGGQHYSETIFFVGERPASTNGIPRDRRPFVLAYSHRTAAFGNDDKDQSGLPFEDEAGVDAAVITASNARPTLMLETRGNEVNGYAALGRLAPGRWGITWLGPYEGGC